jgi:hypothetical protein
MQITGSIVAAFLLTAVAIVAFTYGGIYFLLIF